VLLTRAWDRRQSAGRARSPLRAANRCGHTRPRRAEDCAPYRRLVVHPSNSSVTLSPAIGGGFNLRNEQERRSRSPTQAKACGYNCSHTTRMRPLSLRSLWALGDSYRLSVLSYQGGIGVCAGVSFLRYSASCCGDVGKHNLPRAAGSSLVSGWYGFLRLSDLWPLSVGA